MFTSFPQPARRLARHRLVSIVLTGWCALAALQLPASQALEFERVVSLGDSLFDDSNGNRSPVAAQQVANRLGVPWTNFARSGATSTALLSQGQHTRAANGFGAGDLALVWIGGNDVFWNAPTVTFGNYDPLLDTLRANVETTFQTLRGAGMEVVIFNLPDFAQVPAVHDAVRAIVPFRFLEQEALENFTQAARFWNAELEELAAQYDVSVVDVFTPLATAVDDPATFTLLGNPPIPGPEYGCQFCLFADSVHPSAAVQGRAANAAFEVLNAKYGPDGLPQLLPLDEADLASLAGVVPGDFDGSGITDATDLATWHNGFGDALPSDVADPQANGDANANGFIDGGDLLWWQRSAGALAAVPAAVPVPEPTSYGLCLLLAIGSAALLPRGSVRIANLRG